MKDYEAEDYESYGGSDPIGYRLSEAEANDVVKRLNEENKLLRSKQDEAQKYMEEWRKVNPNPYFFNADGTMRKHVTRYQKKDVEMEKKWQLAHVAESAKFNTILYENFKLISYFVKKIDQYQ